MGVAWTGWTHTIIIAHLKELFGDGWSLDSAKDAEVDVAIHSAWVETRVLAPTEDALADLDDVTKQPSAMNQYWALRSFYKAGVIIDGRSRLVMMLKAEMDEFYANVKDRMASGDVYKYETT